MASRERHCGCSDSTLSPAAFRAPLRLGCADPFHGASGTGKIFPATLLGRPMAYGAFGVDLSVVVSKYVGETEKCLAILFEAVHGKGCALLLAGAFALLGKCMAIKDRDDRNAGREQGCRSCGLAQCWTGFKYAPDFQPTCGTREYPSSRISARGGRVSSSPSAAPARRAGRGGTKACPGRCYRRRHRRQRGRRGPQAQGGNA